MAERTDTRIIKKYQNRKLYDTQDSCYITLDDIAKMIRRGEDVAVVDNQTKGDVTSIILTQILVDQEKASTSNLPLSMLKDIVQRGHGSLFDFIKRYVLLGIDDESERRAEAERYINRLVAKKELTEQEGKTLFSEVVNEPGTTPDVENWVGHQVQKAVGKVGNFENISKTLDSLNSKISQLEGKIRQLEGA